jgi:hypothetical protein
MESPLIDKEIQLERFQGKGGWTYARVPEIPQEKKNPFGWKRVRGFIDDYEFKAYHLMPMGNGQLFLPVKAEIRKAIKKKEGDWVRVRLYPDNMPLETPSEFLACLEYSPSAFEFYKAINETEKKKYITWIYSAKTEETKIERLALSIQNLENGIKLKY